MQYCGHGFLSNSPNPLERGLGLFNSKWIVGVRDRTK